MYHPRKPQQHCCDNHKYCIFDVISHLHQSWLNGQHILSYSGSPGHDVDKVRREIKDGQLVKEAFDPNGVEGFSHVQEHRACQSPLAEIPGYSFNEAGQLQGRAMPGSKPKLLVPQQSKLAYIM